MRLEGSLRRAWAFKSVCLTLFVAQTTGRPHLTECPRDGPEVSYRWSREMDHLFVEGGGCVTLSDIYRDAEDAPLVPMTSNGSETDEETGIWLLTTDLYMESGTTLLLHDDLGCEELRIASNATHPWQLRSNGAYISLLRTKVFSWVREEGHYDEGSPTGDQPRSYISVLSEIIYSGDTCEGAADDDAGEGRMDIINSEVGYLGYQAAESYGISYKVRGYCTDGSNPEVFERVNVRGDIRFSDIHHNWFGLYTYGHQDGLWEYNLMRDNGYYGFDPHDDSDNLRIHNNLVYNNGGHAIIASKRCNDVSIQNNLVWDTTYHGIMLHRSSDNGIIRNNTVTGSGSACIALFESFDIEVSGNICDDNMEGIRLSMGSSHNKIFDNIVTNTQGRSIWFYQGTDIVDASAYVDGMCTDNLFENNFIDTADYAIVMRDARDNKFVSNTFMGADEAEFSNADGLLWTGNEIPSDLRMTISETCINGASDLDQIEAAGGSVTTC